MKGTRLEYRSGTEGPAHDPYGFSEYTVIRKGREVTLHEGLDFWLSAVRYADADSQEEELVICELSYANATEQEMYEMFEELTGIRPHKFLDYYERIHYTCPKCLRVTPTETHPGFPGECFEVCKICHSIVESQFDEFR